MSLLPGTRLGTYEILSLIGAGGMGEVYRARDSRLKRDIAVKVLPEAWTHDTDRVARFHREAELLATLNHPHIAGIYGFEEAAGVKALLLELVDGPTLADRLSQGPVRVDEALAIARQIAEALDAAHERGIIHRDLKPANIKVRADGAVKVLDFGLAKALDPEPASVVDATSLPTMTSPAMTRAGVIVGTAAYMSPEQARGLRVDRRTDIWAFGCVLYEMLTGRAAFAGATVTDVLAAILEREPDWTAVPPTTPTHIVRLLERCLEKDLKRRWRDIGDARIELDTSRPPIDRGEPAPTQTRSAHTRIMGVAAVALIAASVLGTIAIERSFDARAVPIGGPATSSRVLTPATADDGVTADPALSNDGALLAYASDRAGMDNLDIWIQQTAGSTPLQLTHDAADEFQPSFSPDGSRLAYRSEREGGGIYIVPTLGGQDPRLLVQAGRRPRFSPDGRLVAYWTGSVIGFSASSGSYRTFVMPVDGGTPREVEGFTAARYPVWAPDGRSLLLLGSRDPRPLAATYDWWRVPLDGGTPVRLGASTVLQRAGVAFNAGAVYPDDWRSDQVLFSDGSYLWSVRLDPGATTATNVERLTLGTRRDLQVTTAASGVIAFASLSASNSVWALPIDPVRGVVTGAPRRVTGGAGTDSRPSASGDGHLVAYRSVIPRPTINIRSLESQSVLDIGTAGSGFGPAISPDGAYVAYENGGGVDVVFTRGGATRTLCQPCQVGDWTADSRAIVVVKAENNAGRLTWIGLSDGAARDLIVSPDQAVSRPFPSPDGRLLAFRRSGSARDAILIAPIAAGQPIPARAWLELVAPEADARPVGWSPDGALVYFVSGRDGTRCLYAQRVDRATGARTGEPFAVRHFHSGGRNVYRSGGNVLSTGPANAIAGGFFFYDISDLSGNIWIMSAR